MKHLPDHFRWSFSKLAAFKQCPYSFYLSFIDQDQPDEIENYFSQYGSFAHKLLEQWALGDLPEFCLADEWEAGYEEAVTMPPPPFPKGMSEKYYQAALDYFQNFHGFGDEWDVLSAEQKFVLNLDGYNVSGIADLVLRHKDSGDLWVIDHKSKSMNSLKKEMDLYRRQLFFYGLWCHEVFGQYPARLSFNMFKEGCFVDALGSGRKKLDITIPEGVAETRQWFIDSIHEIETCDVFEDWEPRRSNYFCSQICGSAAFCETQQIARAEELEQWKAKKDAERAMMEGLM